MDEFVKLIVFALKHMLHIRNPLFDTHRKTVYKIECCDGVRHITFIIKDGELVE